MENKEIWLADARNKLFTKWHSCLYVFALCNETRIHSSGAPDYDVVEQEKTNAIIKDKNILLFDPAVYTTYVTHVITRPASAVCKSCVDLRTCALKPTNLCTLQQVSLKARWFSQGAFIIMEKSSEYFFKNKLWWQYLLLIENYSMESHWTTTKHVYIGCSVAACVDVMGFASGRLVTCWIVWSGSYACCRQSS